MKRFLGLVGMLVLLSSRNALCQELASFSIPPFGTVRVYRTVEDPSRVVIFSAGEDGWNREAQCLAEQFASMDSLVIGVSTKEYLDPILTQSNCTYPAADFENLGRFVQQKLGLSHYTRPILAGYDSGAALVYATVVQAPSHVFAGGISIGFCPSAPLSRAVCKGLGVGWSKNGRDLLPAGALHTPWLVLPGPRHAGCSANTGAFLKQIRDATILPPDGRESTGDWPEKALLAQALQDLSGKEEPSASSDSPSIKDLPLIEIRATGKPDAAEEDLMAVMISGDGGWAGLDREVGDAIASHGIPMVGFNSLRYFWTPRTAGGTAEDVAKVISHYRKTWEKSRLILIGYSFGADVLPFIVNRLPEAIKAKTELVVLMGPSMSAQFEFHLSNWFEGASDGALPTLPEANKMEAGRIACLYGKDESDSLCPSLDAAKAHVIALPGGHHFDGDYPALARRILSLVEAHGVEAK